MTLETVPRYDRDRVPRVGGRAIVVGGSMAGLLAARVLADGFEEVVVLERDPLSDGSAPRRGVPQGNHVHVLLEAGRATLEDLFPGYGEELISAGGLIIDALSDFLHYEKGGFLADGSTRLPMYCATRPLFERVVRGRVEGLDGVEIRSDSQCTDYLAGDAPAVEGAVVRDGDGGRRELGADLVVDATGRTSNTPAWLDERGYTAPPLEEVEIDVAYSTVAVERPPDERRAFFVPPDPPRTRGAGAFPVEGDRWVATAFGVHGDHPPTDVEELRAFVSSLPTAEPARLFDAGPPTSGEVAHYPFPSNRRYRYEALDRFPGGLVVVGDAISSFNPIYGQGMSVAALEALALHHALAEGGREDLALRFFDRVEPIVEVPWSIAVGGDFEFPQTTGPKPRGTDALNRYLARLIRKAHDDAELRESMYRVFNMEHPPARLFRPGVAWRVLRPARPGTGSASGRSSTRTSGEAQ